MSLKREFVLRAITGSETVSALCREFGISRKTGYKWIRRFQKDGLEGLVEESRRPKNSPLETSAELVVEILALKQAHRRWGPKKIWGALRRSVAAAQLPSVRTVARVLDRAGMVQRRRRRYRPRTGGAPARAPRFSVDAPNDLWTVDFKGWWTTRDGTRCEPLTVRDAYSRFVLTVRILRWTRSRDVRGVFEALFGELGLPRAIQSDNGQPWASTQTPGGLTKLSAWWVSLGIELVRSRVGCPQDNGAHERMHGDMRMELQEHPAATIADQQRLCDRWVHDFNFVRPHEALGLRTPAEFYTPGPATLNRLVVGGYPDGCHTLRVGDSGGISGNVYITSAVAGYDVALQHVGDKVVVWFFDHPLGYFVPGVDERMTPFDFETCHRGNTEGGDTGGNTRGTIRGAADEASTGSLKQEGPE